MNDRKMRNSIHLAVDGYGRELKPDPFLAARVRAQAQRKDGRKMKKIRFSAAFILAALLSLLTVTALAATAYTFIRQARSVQQEKGPLEKWTLEEKKMILEAMQRDGLALDEGKYAALEDAQGEAAQRIANELLLESRLPREALKETYGFEEASFSLFEKTVSIDEAAEAWVVAYRPRRWEERIGSYTVRLSAGSGRVTACAWSLDGLEENAFQPDNWHAAHWPMERVNRLLSFEADREARRAEKEAAEGPFEAWPLRDKAAFDEEILTQGYPRGDFVVNILPDAEDIPESGALAMAQAEAERMGAKEEERAAEQISFFLMPDDSREWLIALRGGYTVEIASPSGEVLSCAGPEKSEREESENTALAADGDWIQAAWEAMKETYGLIEETRPFFSAQLEGENGGAKVTFTSKHYNPRLAGDYVFTLRGETGEILSSQWTLQEAYAQQGKAEPWRAARLWSAYEFNQEALLREKGRKIMAEAGSEVSWGMDFEHQAAYDTLYREAGFSRETYFHGLPTALDIPKEEAVFLAAQAVKEKYGAAEETLELAGPALAFDVTDPDAPVWRVSFLDRESMYAVALSGAGGQVLSCVRMDAGN